MNLTLRIGQAAALVGLLAAARPAPLPLSFISPPTPPCDSVLRATPGKLLSFAVQLADGDPSETVVLRLMGPLPPGATMNPPLPVAGSPSATSVFSWTPTADQLGLGYNLIFGGDNSGGFRAECALTIRVVAPKGDFCSYTQGGWGSVPAGQNPGKILATNFGAVYPNGVEIGIPGAGGNSLSFSSAKAIENFLPSGGTAGALNADALDPVAPTSAGVLAAQVLALQLNVDFSAKGVTTKSGGPLGALKLCGTGSASLDGVTVNDVLAGANQALGGGSLPFGLASYSELNDLVTDLNEGYDACSATDWAKTHLCQ